MLLRGPLNLRATPSGGSGHAQPHPLDEITKEKQRVSEALARVGAQREKLAGQLVELEDRKSVV